MRADHWGWETVNVPVDVMNYRQGRPLSHKEIALYERLTSTQRTTTTEALVTPRVAKASQPSRRVQVYRQLAPGTPLLTITDEAA